MRFNPLLTACCLDLFRKLSILDPFSNITTFDTLSLFLLLTLLLFEFYDLIAFPIKSFRVTVFMLHILTLRYWYLFNPYLPISLIRLLLLLSSYVVTFILLLLYFSFYYCIENYKPQHSCLWYSFVD